MTDGSTKALSEALRSFREHWQDLQDALIVRHEAERPFAPSIRDAEGAVVAQKVMLDHLLSERAADDAYQAAALRVTFLTGTVAGADAAVRAEAISARDADVIKGNVELEGYIVRPRVTRGIEITDPTKFALQVKDKLPDLLDVLAPRTPNPKVVKDHAATLEQLEISGWKRTKKVTATFVVLEKEADGPTDTDA